MSILNLIKKEFSGFTKVEKIVFPMILLLTIFISVVLNDNKIALISSLCGMSYTILAGKGKVSCYFIGIIGTFCYSYLSFINMFWGNLCLYLFYYLPMEIVGIFKWNKHLKKDTRDIIKTQLSVKERYLYSFLIILGSLACSILIRFLGGANPIIDSITTIMSIIGQILTVKRCIEQWYVWFFVNLLSLIMWLIAYINGSNCFSTIIMWTVYLALSIYFLISWKKELK